LLTTFFFLLPSLSHSIPSSFCPSVLFISLSVYSLYLPLPFSFFHKKGKNVPKLKFDNLMITIAFNFSASLQYSLEKSKWFIDPKQFQLNILSFKGPYGLNRSIVSLVVSLLTPTLRSLLLKNLPFELGLLVRTLQCPLTMEGEFDIKGKR
jgi:hypothetical protein